jgi:hypothetical protein
MNPQNMKNVKNEVISTEQLRKFGLSFSALVLIIFGLLLPWLLAKKAPIFVWYIAGIFTLWSTIAPNTLRCFYSRWMWLAQLLNKITTPIILTLCYVFMIIPIGFMMRIVGANVLQKSFNKQVESYRSPSSPIEKKSFEKPF